MDAPVKRLIALAAAIVIGTQLALRCSSSEATLDERLEIARHLAAEERIDEAFQAYQHAAREFPREPRAWIAYGDASLDLLHDARMADEAYRDGCAASTTPTAVAPAFRRRGLLAWACGGADLADGWLLRAAEAGDAPAREALALLRSCLVRPDAAQALESAQRLLPTNPRLLLCAAADAAIAGDRARALALLAQGLSAAGASERPELATDPWVRFLAARIQAALGEQVRAAELLNAARDVAPSARAEAAPPLRRADLAGDPAFAKTGSELAAAIARWPEAPPLSLP